jgi:hypothetical protein
MRKSVVALVYGAALLASGAMVWSAQANTSSSAVALKPAPQSSSIVEKAACRGWGPHCRPGWTWYCGPRGWCRCVRC